MNSGGEEHGSASPSMNEVEFLVALTEKQGEDAIFGGESEDKRQLSQCYETCSQTVHEHDEVTDPEESVSNHLLDWDCL